MIQPQELRIGNWALCQQSYAVVTQILAPDLLDLRCEDGCNRFCNIGDVSPIELSPEVLAKCGFKETMETGWWTLMDEDIWLRLSDETGWDYLVMHSVNQPAWTTIATLRHLHQLQNAFTALNDGKELSFTP